MLYPTITSLIDDLPKPSADRLANLIPLVDYLKEKKNRRELIRLNFICTHNSRRSHLAQVWAQALAKHHHVPKVITYSGGTEATALFPKVADTLVGQGFKITKLSHGDNPVYAIKYAADQHPVMGFSKSYDDEFNPQGRFAAIMTCSQADVGCPLVGGCEKRIAITYEDPKVSDGTDTQSQVYWDRSLQIASEMNWVMKEAARS